MEQIIEQRHRVGDVYPGIAVRVERGDTTGLGWSHEQPVERAGGVGDVDHAIAVAVAADENLYGRTGPTVEGFLYELAFALIRLAW